MDLHHAWLVHFSSSRLPASTNYLTAIVFTFSTTYQRHISGNRRVKELNLSEPFRAHRNNLHSYHNCIRGKYSGRSETAMFEIAFATTLYNFMRTFYRLRQTFSQVYCRKLAQCVGLEPTRRTNARPDSNRLQFHYGNTAKLTRFTRSKATKRIGIFSSVLSELLLLYFLLAACLLCVYFITTRILLLKNTQDLSLGLQESNPRQPGYKPCLLPLN